jgi:NADPH2:quinone reductase
VKAIVCREISDDIATLKLQEMELPSLASNEARVRIRAAAVNFTDILTVQGKYQHKPAVPFTPGSEAAGDIIAVGSTVTEVKVGDRVICGGLGCYAEETQLPAAMLRKIPDGVGYAEAASFTVGYLTAYVALVRRAHLQAGEWLLVHGAAGGVGLAAVDLGKVLGAKVIATASSDAKRAFLNDYGADHVLAPSGFRDAVKNLTNGRGADVIYDPVGGAYAEAALRSIAWAGRFLVIGFAAGEIPKIPLNLALLKGCDIVGVFWGAFIERDPKGHQANMADLVRWSAEGKLSAHVHAVYPLANTREALEAIAGRKVMGKVILRP